jgi:hypothetical protein
MAGDSARKDVGALGHAVLGAACLRRDGGHTAESPVDGTDTLIVGREGAELALAIPSAVGDDVVDALTARAEKTGFHVDTSFVFVD